FRLLYANSEWEMLVSYKVSKYGIRIENHDRAIEVTFRRAVRPDALKVEALPTVVYFVFDGSDIFRAIDLPAIAIGSVYLEGPTFLVEGLEIIYESSIVKRCVNAGHDLR